MSQPRTGKKNIRSAYPEVARFAAYLDELVKSRTSENKFIQAAQVGKSKLSTYLEGIEVPDKRVLDYYFCRPLEGFRPLTATERQTLLELYREACRMQDPRNPTPTDKINFLEEDLARARGELAGLTERLERAIKQERAASEQVERMRQDREILLAQLQELTAQASALQRELKESEQDYQAKLGEANRMLAEFGRELGACHETISALEVALSDHVETGIALKRVVDSQHQQLGLLQEQIADERRLFMELVTNAMDGKAVARLSARIELSERTIAQQTEIIQNLAETNYALAQERDLLGQERDFLLVAEQAHPVTEVAPTRVDLDSVPPTTTTPSDEYFPAAVPLPRPREPQQRWDDDEIMLSLPNILLALLHHAASPTEGTPPGEAT